MKKILILGATGLIGFSLYKTLTQLGHNVCVTTRKPHKDVLQTLTLFSDQEKVAAAFDATRMNQLAGLLAAWRPDVVLNCIGITKRRPEINIPEEAIRVNALFPHKLNTLTTDMGIRMIHFSTDCVFDGTNGPYNEESLTSPLDAYGRTKALGEIHDGAALTIRSSFIGREIYEKSELLEWFLNTDNAAGFEHVYYSGVSTTFLSTVVSTIVEQHPELSGLYQLAAPEPIAKYHLLTHAQQAFAWKGTLTKNSTVSSMPTLDGSKLQKIVGYTVPDWATMMEELASQVYPIGMNKNDSVSG